MVVNLFNKVQWGQNINHSYLFKFVKNIRKNKTFLTGEKLRNLASSFFSHTGAQAFLYIVNKS